MRDGRAMYNWITGNNYADRDTDWNVIKNQTEQALMNADNLVSAVMTMAGYKLDNAAYYKRIYEAQKDGNEAAAQNMIDYLIKGKGVKEETITTKMKSLAKEDESMTYPERIKALREKGMEDSDIASWIVKEYKEGKLKKDEAIKLWQEANPKKDADDAYFKFEQADWEAETGENVTDTDWFRMDKAIDSNNAEDYKTAVRELKAHGYKDNEISEHATKRITNMYKEGEITRKEAETRLRKYDSSMTANDAWWKLDRIDYKKETGKEAGSGQYYRLYDAIEANKSAEIKSAVKTMTAHGMKDENIKKQLATKYKKQYLQATGNKKVQLKNALIMAYKALGYSDAEANEIINGWK